MFASSFCRNRQAVALPITRAVDSRLHQSDLSDRFRESRHSDRTNWYQADRPLADCRRSLPVNIYVDEYF
jgi:hypothetical protein